MRQAADGPAQRRERPTAQRGDAAAAAAGAWEGPRGEPASSPRGRGRGEAVAAPQRRPGGRAPVLTPLSLQCRAASAWRRARWRQCQRLSFGGGRGQRPAAPDARVVRVEEGRGRRRGVAGARGREGGARRRRRRWRLLPDGGAGRAARPVLPVQKRAKREERPLLDLRDSNNAMFDLNHLTRCMVNQFLLILKEVVRSQV